MRENRYNNLTGEKLEEAILREKERGTSDLEIGKNMVLPIAILKKLLLKIRA